MTKDWSVALREYVQWNGDCPSYEERVQGPPHNPSHELKIVVGGLEAIGTGKTKKEAKCNATKSIMELIRSRNAANIGNPPPVESRCVGEQNRCIDLSNGLMQGLLIDEESQGEAQFDNYVGELQVRLASMFNTNLL